MNANDIIRSDAAKPAVTRDVMVRLSQPAGDPGIRVTETPTPSTTGTQSSVANAAADTLILASNTSRLGASVYNDPAGGAGTPLYLRCTTGAATTVNFSTIVQPGQLYEIPFRYTGQIRAIAGGALGSARIMEYT